jgi:CDP-diacylglycerol---glycerol-3-phosphate 3-phosphatidyltransferase
MEIRVANLITVARLPLLVGIVLCLYSPNPILRLITVPLLVVLIAMDSVDGIIARRRGEESILGSVLDIMVDRVVELVLWVVYAHLGLIPVAVPIIYIMRGTIVDSLRNMSSASEGTAPFNTLHTPLGAWLVGSPWMRSTYGISKLISFSGLALTHTLAAYAVRGVVSENTVSLALVIFNITTWISVVFCLVRGFPVIIEKLLQYSANGQGPASEGGGHSAPPAGR